MLRAVRAAHDPAWTADGYVSDRWRPVSPVSGRLDAFQWVTPVAALPSDKSHAIESSAWEEALLAAPRAVSEKPAASISSGAIATPAVSAAATNGTQPPVFRPRPVGEAVKPAAVPAVIPLVRAPDDPGVPETAVEDDFIDPDRPDAAQPGGFKGFLSRLVG